MKPANGRPLLQIGGWCVSDPAKLIDLAARFRRHSKPFRSRGLKARAELSVAAGGEASGIWRLIPKDRETEAAWVTFSLLASLGIEELGIPPTPAPEALEFDPTWQEQCAQMQVDSSETIPAGLDAVDACTRAWLNFLRCESLRNGSAAFRRRSAGGSFPDVWEASAAQCERSAQVGIQTRLANHHRIPRQRIAHDELTVARNLKDETLNLLKKILEKRPTTLEKWAGEHKLGRTSVFDWKASRGTGKSLKGKVGDSKIAAIEKAIEDDAKALGLPLGLARTSSDSSG